MATYTIIGGDQKEYGPITAEDIGLWIGEGRLNEHSLVKAEGDAEFRPLASFPEFAGAFAAKTPMSGMPPAFARSSGSANWDGRDYDLDLGGCISRGWDLVKNNFGLLFVAPLIYFLIQIGIRILAAIPFIGALFSLVNFLAAGAFMGGLFYLFIRVMRQEPASLGDMFAGFRRSFGQLFLGTLVQGLLIGLCLLPFLIFFLIKLVPLIKGVNLETMSQQETLNFVKSILANAVIPSLGWLLICEIPVIYLSVCWKFTLPLIIDKQMDFWTAMGTSRKMVKKHWWLVFGLTILISLLNLAGFCACCIGLLFTIPIGIAALMFAYETIFSEGPAA